MPPEPVTRPVTAVTSSTTCCPVAAGVGGETDVNRNPAVQGLFINPIIGAGIVPIVAVGDFVWNDANGNGKQDKTERGFANVQVTLTDAWGDPVTDNNGNEVAPVLTNAKGKYFFDNLRPGSYRIRFEPPTGHMLTYQFAGSSRKIDSNADRETGLSDIFAIADRVLGDTVADTSTTTLAIFVNPTIEAGIFEPTLPETF